MATMTLPSVPPKHHTKSAVPKAPSSYRCSESGSISTSDDVPHMIHVTVLGLAGVMVNQSNCRDPSTKGVGSTSKSWPPPPSKMRAIVAFSHRGEMRGTTHLSKALSPSPKKSAKNENLDSCRHLAMWATGEKAVGAEVVFEDELHRSDNHSSSGRSISSFSSFSPKSFDVTVALTEDSDSDSKIAIPLGVANLTVTGDESADGNCITMDLPIRNLDHSKPVSGSENAPSKYPLISIQRKTTHDDLADLSKKRKPSSLKNRLFKSKTSTLDREAFLSAYSVDAAGDAVLRVKLEVYDKSKEGVFGVLRRQRNADALKNSRSVPSTGSANDSFTSAPSDEGRTPRTRYSAYGGHLEYEIQAMSNELGRVAVDDVANEERVLKKEPSDTDETTPSQDAQEVDSLNESLLAYDDDTWAEDDTYLTFDDATMRTDDYTLSFTPKEGDTPTEGDTRGEVQENVKPPPDDKDRLGDYMEEEDGELYLKLFGQRIRLPSCRAPMADDFEVDDKGNTRVAVEAFGRNFKVPVCSAVVPPRDEFDDGETYTTQGSRWQDELTMVSAKVFGRKVRIPMPRDIIPPRDSDTITTTSFRSREPRSRRRRIDEQNLEAFISNSIRYAEDGGTAFDESTLGDVTAGYDLASVDSVMKDATEVSLEIEDLLGQYEASELLKVPNPTVTTPRESQRKDEVKSSTKSKRASRSPKFRKRQAQKDDESEQDSSTDGVPLWQEGSPKKGQTLVEIGVDRADSVSEPTIYKLDKGIESPPRSKYDFSTGITKTKSSSSPQGVADVNDIYSPPAHGVTALSDEFPDAGNTNFAQSFADFVTCRVTPLTVGHVTDDDYFYQKEVPPLIIPRDDSTVGDLTATTHEQQIASRSNLARKKQSKGNNGFDREASNSAWDGFSRTEHYFNDYGEDNSILLHNGQHRTAVATREQEVASPSHGWIKPWKEESTAASKQKSKKKSLGRRRSKSKRKTGGTQPQTNPDLSLFLKDLEIDRVVETPSDREAKSKHQVATEAGIEQELHLGSAGSTFSF